MSPSAEILICVVSTNDGKWLPRCLEALANARGPRFDVLLVDNASSDGAAAVAERPTVQCRVLPTSQKLGFSEANNLAIRDAGARGYKYAFLLNPDTIVHPEAIARLHDFLEKNPSYGIAGSRQIAYEGDQWDQPNRWTTETLEHARQLGSQELELGDHRVVEHLYVQGAALMVRTSLLQRIGLLDPVYVTFYEETDLCRRCWLSGNRVAIVLDSKVKHFEGGNWKRSAADRLRRDTIFLSNQYLFEMAATHDAKAAVRVAARLLKDQIRAVVNRREELTMTVWQYPAVLRRMLGRLSVVSAMRARNDLIRAGRPLPDHYRAIGAGAGRAA